MTDLLQEEKLATVSQKPLKEKQIYHYSPVPSDCIACAARPTSRKHKELEEQKSDIICGPFPSREDLCHLPQTPFKEKYHRAQLHIVSTNRRVKVFGKWTEEKLLAAVTDRLLQRATSIPPPPYEKIPPPAIKLLSIGVPYDPIIHRGIFSESILRQLYCGGASESVLIRAMKFGLRHLKPEDLNYFVQFGVSITVLHSHKLWKELIDESLVTPLRTMGFDEKASRKIVLSGMLSQNEVCLMQMMLAGVDVPGILNWQGPTMEIEARMTQFLRKLGVVEDVLQLVVQKGIDEETYEMLKDLGYTETEEEEHFGTHEVVICECDLTVFESKASSVISVSCACGKKSSKTLVSTLDYSKASIEAGGTCACFNSTISLTQSSSLSSHPNLVDCSDIHAKQNSLKKSEILAERDDYLRRTIMVPLAWAMAKALQYRPSDPKHYIACQLVRWRHGEISETEMKETEDFVVTRTIEMDKKLMEQKQKDEEELKAKRDAEILQNIPCHPCWQHQQIHRVKERCWKCIKKWVPNYEACELPKICSSCKVDLSDILNSDTSKTSTGSISIVPSAGDAQKQTSKHTKGSTSPNQHSYREEMESFNYHDTNIYEGSFASSSNGDNIKGSAH